MSPIAYKKPIRAKEDNEEYAIEMEIIWNEEFSELMDLGISEMLDRESKKKPFYKNFLFCLQQIPLNFFHFPPANIQK
jgi:hypothetical protein